MKFSLWKGMKFAPFSVMENVTPFRIPFFLYLLFFAGVHDPLSAQQLTPPAQMETRFGWNMAPYGRLHVLVLYVELEFDSIYADLNPVKENDNNWVSGEMPKWKNQLFSPTPDGDGYMTRYFRQASFGQFQVTGDYLDTLLRVKISEVRNERGQVITTEPYGNNYFRKAVIAAANRIPDPRLGNQSDWREFDHWKLTTPGRPKIDTANGQLDLVMIIYRNIHCPGMGEQSGFVQTGSAGKLWGLSSDMFSQFRTSKYLPTSLTRHEFSHMLYGGNNFHTANGGVGQRTFMATVGGYSNMSGSDCYSETWNGWDRERMGWKNPDNEFLVNCHCEDGSQIDGRLEYGKDACPGGVYVLGDFVTQGDMLRVKLPHLPAGVKQQYLWIENHQLVPGMLDHNKALPKGMYAYITVGKDKLAGNDIFGGENNYLWPLAPIGNYDMSFANENKLMIIKDEFANPFTGAHYYMRYPADLDGDGTVRVTPDNGTRTEYILAEDLEINGVRPPDEYFSYMRYPQFGTTDGAFFPGNKAKIGISTNPAAVPLYTYSANDRPHRSDNRRIWLNGLSVEVLEMRANGTMKVRIRWDDYDIDQNVRWCGDIVNTETVRLGSRREILLDQGFTPQLSKPALQMDGQNIFAEPTVFTLDSGSVTELGEKSKLVLRNGSSLLIRKGASLSLGDGARIIVEPGCFIYAEEGAEIETGNRAGIEMQAGAQTGINPILAVKMGPFKPMVPGFP